MPGIETVYQNLALSPALSIADNMFLGREIRKPGILGSVFRMLDRAAMEKRARDKLTELGPDDHPEHQPGGRNPVRRPAPGRGRGPRRGLRLQGRHHGRTDRRAGRQGMPPRARTDPRREARAACRSS